MLHKLVEGGVQVDLVRAAPVADTGQLADAAPGGNVPARAGNGQPRGDLPGPPQRLQVQLTARRNLIELPRRLVGEAGPPGALVTTGRAATAAL
jgi:hypothetical protein